MKRKKYFGFSDYEDNIENENQEEKELENEDENEETEFGAQDNKVRGLKSELENIIRDSLNYSLNIKKIIDTLSPFLRSEYSDDPEVKKVLAKLITLAISEEVYKSSIENPSKIPEYARRVLEGLGYGDIAKYFNEIEDEIEDENEDEYLENYIPTTYSYLSGARSPDLDYIKSVIEQWLYTVPSKNVIDSDKLNKLLESVYKSGSDSEIFKDILAKLLVKVITENPKNADNYRDYYTPELSTYIRRFLAERGYGDLVEYFNEMENESEDKEDKDSMIEEIVENFIKSYSNNGYSGRVNQKFGKRISFDEYAEDESKGDESKEDKDSMIEEMVNNFIKSYSRGYSGRVSKKIERFNEDEDENENKEGDSDVPFGSDEYVEDEGEELEVEEISDKIANRLFNKIFKNK